MALKFKHVIYRKLIKKIFLLMPRNTNLQLINISNRLHNLSEFIEIYRCSLLDFDYRPDDILIVTYPRSGTTWMQMILYQLKTNGKMDFDHISQVCPWLERTIFSKRIISKEEIESIDSPRIFKSHLQYRFFLNANCRFIYVIRNCMDVAVSYYNLYKSHLKFEGTFDNFFYNYFIPGKIKYGSWFKHVAGWWHNRNDKNILFIKYEELTNDFETSIQKIMKFSRLTVPKMKMPEILKKCNFSFMKQHEQKFDHRSEVQWESIRKIAHMAEDKFIRMGMPGQGGPYLSNAKEMLVKEKMEKYFDDSFLKSFL